MTSVLSKLFRRPPGSGWLVVSGGPMPEDLIERALALVIHAGSIVAVVPSPQELPAAETVLQVWTDISGWNGRAVDCESYAELEDRLSEAALVLLPDLADPAKYARALGQTDACEFLLAALDAGVVIVAEGAAAEALGEEIGSPGEQAGIGLTDSPALRWLPGAILQTHFEEGHAPPSSWKRKDRFRIGLPEGISIVLGPAEEREIWGDGKPTVTFREWWKE
jgi:hypothetical protein